MQLECLKGLVVASVTPFCGNGRIDEQGTRNLIQYYIKEGMSGAFLLSSTGEYFAMTPRQREEFVEIAADAAGGKLPLMAMVSDACLQNVLHNIDCMARYPLDALVLTAPYYYKYSQQELYRFFCTAADHSPVPLMLYNQPMRLPNSLEIGLVERLSRHPNIAGIKDTSTDAARIPRLLRICEESGDFLYFAGSEGLAAQAALLGGSFVYALAAVRPKLFLDILQKAKEKDIAAVCTLQAEVDRMFGLFQAVHGGYRDSFSNFTYGIKAALEVKGICKAYNAQLNSDLDETDYQRVKDCLEGF